MQKRVSKKKYIYIFLISLFIAMLLPVLPVRAATYALDKPVISSVENTNTGITVKWGSVAGAEAYTILRKTGETGNWVKKATVKKTNWTDTSAVSGKTYYYAVRCSNSDGTAYTSLRDSKGTAVFCIRSRNISAANKPDGVQLSWSKITNVNEYEVYRRVSGTEEWETLLTTSEIKAIDINVQNNTTYEYAVCGKKKIDGGYVYGPLDKSKIKKIRFLSAPSITSIKQNETDIKITWNTVKGSSWYTVLRKVNDGAWTKKATTCNAYWTDTAGKTSGNVYTYAIRCSNSTGTEYLSGRDNGTSYTYLKKPEVKSLTTLETGVKITLSFVKCTESYEIHRKDIREGTDIVVKTGTNNGKNSAIYTDKSAVGNTEYSYYAVAKCGETSASSDTKDILFCPHPAYIKITKITEADWLPIEDGFPVELMAGEKRQSEETFVKINSYYQRLYDAVIEAGVTEDMDEMTAFFRLRQWLCDNCEYDYSHSYYDWEDVLDYKSATCNGYTQIFQLMCKICGIECYRQHGTAKGGNHAWNYLRLNGDWFYADVTWFDIDPRYDITRTLYGSHAIILEYPNCAEARDKADLLKSPIQVSYKSNCEPSRTHVPSCEYSYYENGTYVKLGEYGFTPPEGQTFAYWAYDKDGKSRAGVPGEWVYLKNGSETVFYAIYKNIK